MKQNDFQFKKKQHHFYSYWMLTYYNNNLKKEMPANVTQERLAEDNPLL